MNIRMTIPKKRDNSGTAVLYIVRPDFVGPTLRMSRAPAEVQRRVGSIRGLARRSSGIESVRP